MTGRIVLEGLLSEHNCGESVDVLFLSSVKDPLVDYLLDEIKGKKVSVRYWLSDRPISQEEALEVVAKLSVGIVDGKFGAVYSDITGYLWTDEDLTVGGHDLAGELRSGVGRYLRFEVDVEGEVEE